MTKENTNTKYVEAVGRRKTSVARVRMTKSNKNTFSVNDREIHKYFPTSELLEIVKEPITRSEMRDKFTVSVKVKGGGVHSQAEAVRHGISRVLVMIDDELRKELKKAGFLKRDPRSKERKKFGLRKARRAPQWSKR